MQDEDMEKEAVLRYLRRKGLRFTELALQEELIRLSTGQLSQVSRSVNDAERFSDGISQEALLPLNAELMVDMVKTVSPSALVGISALNLIAAKLEDIPYHGYKACYVCPYILHSLPYTYLPFGMISVALAIGATKQPQLLGAASGFLLLQFVYVLIVGAMSATVRTGLPVLLVVAITSSLILVLLFSWGFVCKYPQCVSKVTHWYAQLPFRFASLVKGMAVTAAQLTRNFASLVKKKSIAAGQRMRSFARLITRTRTSVSGVVDGHDLEAQDILADSRSKVH